MTDDQGSAAAGSAMRIERRADPEAAARILASLPEWFGIPEANGHYVEAAGTMPSYLAIAGDTTVGVLLLPQHSDGAAEVYLIAVERAWRGHGVGSALLAAAEADLATRGVRLLQVKTLGPSRPHEGYAETRAFYERRGFLPLEELHGFWDQNPCLIMVKPLP